MAFALSTSASTSRAPMRLFSSGFSHGHRRLSAGGLKPPGLIPPRHSLSSSTLAFSRRRNHDPAIKSSSSKKKSMKKKSLCRENGDEGDMEDDPVEVLISMLEEDLENDTSSADEETDDEELNEEDVHNIDKLAQELEEVLGDMELSNSVADGMKSGEEEEEEEEEDDSGDDDDGEEDDKIKNKKKKKITILCFD